MGLLLAFFFISLSVSFLCSILEAVLLSISSAFVARQQQEQTKIANDLASYKADIDRPLSAILTLNTVAHTVGAIGVGAQAALLFGNAEVAGVSFVSWEAVIAGVMTLAILIFSEIIPKTLGANNWEALASFTVFTLKIILFILSPMVWISQLITRNLKKDKNRPVLTRSEFKAIAQIGHESGALNESEQQIINNLLQFNRVLVKDIMTPRIVAFIADENMTVSDLHNRHKNIPFSRIPVYHEHSDNITGYVLKDEALLNLIEDNGDKLLADMKRHLTVVHKQLPIPVLLDNFVAKKEHMALVVDEFGGMEGIVTMEDIVETLLGLEIVDEMDDTEDMQALARKNWEIRARRMGIIAANNSSTNKNKK